MFGIHGGRKLLQREYVKALNVRTRKHQYSADRQQTPTLLNKLRRFEQMFNHLKTYDQVYCPAAEVYVFDRQFYDFEPTVPAALCKVRRRLNSYDMLECFESLDLLTERAETGPNFQDSPHVDLI